MLSDISKFEWVIFAVVSAILTGLMPAFLKLGTKKIAPSVSACIYCALYCVFLAMVFVINKDVGLFSALSQGSVIKLICLGTITAFAYLSLTTALSYGGVSKVVPLLLLRTLISEGIGLYTNSQVPSKLQIFAFIMLILGILLLESGKCRDSESIWILFGMIALVLFVLRDILTERIWTDPVTLSDSAGLITTLIAATELFLISLLGRIANKPGRLTFNNWVFLLLAGISSGLAVLCANRAEMNGLAQYYKPISSLWFPVSMLCARIIHKEEFPVGALFGILLVIVGSFILMIA